MERILKKSKNFKDAEEWDIRQCLEMIPEERQAAALELKRRVYGEAPDVRESHPR